MEVEAQPIETAHETDTPVGVCGQAPSEYPGFAAFVGQSGIVSISLNPDNSVDVKRRVARAEST